MLHYIFFIKSCRVYAFAVSLVAGMFAHGSDEPAVSPPAGPAATEATGASLAGVETPPTPEMPVAADLVARAEIDDTDRAGATEGVFRVNEGGGATYSIPIMTVAGTAGVAPEVALVYDSHAGNGIMGLGWSVRGQSSITRCRPTMHQDRASKAIQWNAEDRFCLDGQRLLAVAGTYGSPDSEYRTEIDSFVRVSAKGGIAGNPDYWEVRGKDGSVRTYGGSADSEVKGGTANLSWSLRQFADSVGNRMLYIYDNDEDGQRLKGIRYAYGAGTGDLDHQAYLRFRYEERDDDMVSHVAGHKFASRKRLRQAESWNRAGGRWHTLREYRIAYKLPGTGIVDKRSKVASVQECVRGKCLPKTVFQWGDKQHGFNSWASASYLMEAERDLFLRGWQPADINGDGRQDLVYMLLDGDRRKGGRYRDYDHRILYALANANGTGWRHTPFSRGGEDVSLIEYRENDDEKVQFRVIDYNADGRSDLAVWASRGRQWHVRLATPQADGSWRLAADAMDIGITQEDVHFTDLNADGLVDAVYVDGGSVKARYLVRDTAQAASAPRFYRFGAETWISNATSIEAGSYDFNGDGRSDLMVRRVSTRDKGRGDRKFSWTSSWGPLVAESGGEWTMLRDYARGWPPSPTLPESLHAADYNGDGLTDVLRALDGSRYVDISTGTGLVTVDPGLSTWHSTEDLPPFDYNGDGHPDFIWRNHAGGGSVVKARLWDPNADTFESASHSIPAPLTHWRDGEGHQFVDMDGDSHLDYVRVDGSYIRVYLSKNRGAFPDRITKITSGLGAETDIRYERLSTTSHYKRPSPGRTQEDREAFYYQLREGWSIPWSIDGWRVHTLWRTAPLLELAGPVPVVTRVDSSAPTAADTDAKSAIEYFYEGGRMMACGRGFIGFAKLSTREMQTGVETATSYRQDWPLTGRPTLTETRTAAGHLLDRTRTDYSLRGFDRWAWWGTALDEGTAGLGPIRFSAERVTAWRYGLADDGASEGELVSKATTTTYYDVHGNVTDMRVRTEGGGKRFKTRTVNTYGPTDADRELGRLTQSVVTKERDEDGDFVWDKTSARRTSFSYYGQSACPVAGAAKLAGLLCQETTDPDRAALKVAATHSYDRFGNRVRTKAEAGSGDGKVTRCDVDTAAYDAHGRWVDTVRDCLGRRTSHVASRDKHGQPVEVRQYLNTAGTAWRTVRHAYTDRGAGYFEGDATGAWKTSVAKRGGHAACPAGTAMHTRARAAGGGESVVCLDRLARTVRAATKGFDGRWSLQDTEYDHKGRAVRTSSPYWQGDTTCQTGSIGSAPQTQCWTGLSHDLRDRVVETALPDGTRSSAAYSGLTQTATNAHGQTHTETRNVLGDLVTSTDARGHRVEFEYDAQGNMTVSTVRKAGGSGPTAISTVVSYDLLGRRTAVDDPHKGRWTYGYNAAGELTRQTTATGDRTEMAYDGLGRMTGRRDYAGTALESDTTWTWDTAANGLGQLDNVQDSVSGYVKAVEYDALGRPSETVTSLGTGGAHGDHYEKVTYDEFGRVFQTFDASREAADYSDGGVRHVYNEYGYLLKAQDAVRNSDGSPRRVYRTVQSLDAAGAVVSERLGNGVARRHWRDGQTGRVRGIQGTKASAGDVQDLAYSWDALGNLTSRTERSGGKDLRETFRYDHRLNRLRTATVEGRGTTTLAYNGYGNIVRKSDVGDYVYHDDLPNAVKTAGGVTYSYDANGNNISSTDGRTLAYTVFDKVKTAAKGGHETAFEYGPDRARYLRTDTATGGTTTTLYLGGVEKVTHPDGRREVRRYIGGLVIETKKYSAAGTLTAAETQYTLKDHLGSIDVITDATGAVVQELSFDPWGQRRSASTWQGMTEAQLTGFDSGRTRRGFTGHEHLDQLGIVHMNGRIYDPKLARFLQADIQVQFPSLTQSHNRYSYAHNSPLAFTDPSGYGLSPFDIFKFVVTLVAAYICQSCAAYVAGAFAAGETLYHGGSFGDALVAGVASAALSYVGSTIAGTDAGFGFNWQTFGFAVAGGITSVLQGGRFGHGFIAAGAGALASRLPLGTQTGFGRSVGRALARAAVGGTISKATGGKFANGAAYGAFASLVNDAGRAIEARRSATSASVNDAAVLGETPSDIHNGVVKDQVLSEVLRVDGNTIKGTVKVAAAVNDRRVLARLTPFVKGANEVWRNKTLSTADGVQYTSEIHFVISGEDGAHVILRTNPLAHINPNIMTIKRDVMIPYGTSWTHALSPGHEIGHVLGLGHQANSTNSIMSYSLERSLQAEDIKRLVNAYRKATP